MYVTKGTVKLAKALSAFFLGFYQIRTLFKGCMGQSLQCVASAALPLWVSPRGKGTQHCVMASCLQLLSPQV